MCPRKLRLNNLLQQSSVQSCTVHKEPQDPTAAAIANTDSKRRICGKQGAAPSLSGEAFCKLGERNSNARDQKWSAQQDCIYVTERFAFLCLIYIYAFFFSFTHNFISETKPFLGLFFFFFLNHAETQRCPLRISGGCEEPRLGGK